MAASAAAAAVAAADGRKANPNAALGGVATRRSTRRENSLGGTTAVENADADDAAAAIGDIDAGCDEDQHRLLERDGRSDTDRHARLLLLLLLLRECAPTRLGCREPPPPPLALLRPLLVRLDGLLRLRLRCGANGGSDGRCCGEKRET